ncbi:hypothetical protein LTS18_004349, partial [Coniosporium uncinatum]
PRHSPPPRPPAPPSTPPPPPLPPPSQSIGPDEPLARSLQHQYSTERRNYIAQHNARVEREFNENLDVRAAMDFARREYERQQEPSRALARCLREEEDRRKGDGGRWKRGRWIRWIGYVL